MSVQDPKNNGENANKDVRQNNDAKQSLDKRPVVQSVRDPFLNNSPRFRLSQKIKDEMSKELETMIFEATIPKKEPYFQNYLAGILRGSQETLKSSILNSIISELEFLTFDRTLEAFKSIFKTAVEEGIEKYGSQTGDRDIYLTFRWTTDLENRIQLGFESRLCDEYWAQQRLRAEEEREVTRFDENLRNGRLKNKTMQFLDPRPENVAQRAVMDDRSLAQLVEFMMREVDSARMDRSCRVGETEDPQLKIWMTAYEQVKKLRAETEREAETERKIEVAAQAVPSGVSSQDADQVGSRGVRTRDVTHGFGAYKESSESLGVSSGVPQGIPQGILQPKNSGASKLKIS